MTAVCSGEKQPGKSRHGSRMAVDFAGLKKIHGVVVAQPNPAEISILENW
jgi:hypothetical protein